MYKTRFFYLKIVFKIVGRLISILSPQKYMGACYTWKNMVHCFFLRSQMETTQSLLLPSNFLYPHNIHLSPPILPMPITILKLQLIMGGEGINFFD